MKFSLISIIYVEILIRRANAIHPKESRFCDPESRMTRYLVSDWKSIIFQITALGITDKKLF